MYFVLTPIRGVEKVELWALRVHPALFTTSSGLILIFPRIRMERNPVQKGKGPGVFPDLFFFSTDCYPAPSSAPSAAQSETPGSKVQGILRYAGPVLSDGGEHLVRHLLLKCLRRLVLCLHGQTAEDVLGDEIIFSQLAGEINFI